LIELAAYGQVVCGDHDIDIAASFTQPPNSFLLAGLERGVNDQCCYQCREPSE
jgi:hypothetical protein